MKFTEGLIGLGISGSSKFRSVIHPDYICSEVAFRQGLAARIIVTLRGNDGATTSRTFT